MGDLDCPIPVTEQFAALLAAGWSVRWILGNHDCETETAYDNLVTSHPDGDLGFRVTEVDGVRIAGLEYSWPCDFLEVPGPSSASPYGVIGRAGFLDDFAVCVVKPDWTLRRRNWWAATATGR